MNIDVRCREIVETALPDFTYVFADWFDADRLVSKLPLPCVVRVLPVGGVLSFKNGRVSDTENGLIAFLDRVPKDATGDEQAAVYNRMKQAAVTFIDAAKRSGYFEPITAATYGVIYEQLSTIVSGVSIEVALTEVPVCL